MIAWMVRTADGADDRILRLPDDCDPSEQLEPGEEAVLYDAPTMAPRLDPLPLPVVTEDMLLAQVDREAGEARKAMLTLVPGQADAYREKMADVASLNMLGSTTALILTALKLLPAAEQKARWPFLYAEMQAAGFATLVQARDAVAAAANASRGARAEIERKRRVAKIAIRAAKTIAAKQAAAKVNWS